MADLNDIRIEFFPQDIKDIGILLERMEKDLGDKEHFLRDIQEIRKVLDTGKVKEEK